MLGVVRSATLRTLDITTREADGGAFALGHRAMPVTTIIILVVLFIVGWLMLGGAQMSTHQIKTPAVTQNPPAAAAASFHGVLRYHDSSRWSRTITLALAQWNAAHIGVTFKPSTDAEGADVLIVSDQSTLNGVRTRNSPSPAAMASRIGIQPGEPVTITLGNPPAFPPSGADVRLVVHELGHVLGLSHTRTPCAVMNSEAQWLPDCHRLGWFVSNGKAMCGPTLGDIRRAQGIWRGKPAAPDPYCTAATTLDEGRERTEYVRQNIAQITARALLGVDHERTSRP
jgi:Matrixin